jgi:hypothetical protein
LAVVAGEEGVARTEFSNDDDLPKAVAPPNDAAPPKVAIRGVIAQGMEPSETGLGASGVVPSEGAFPLNSNGMV